MTVLKRSNESLRMINNVVLIALITPNNMYGDTSLYPPREIGVEKICNGCLISRMGAIRREMGDSAHSIADGTLELAGKCWTFGVRFPRDSSFAAELSLFYER
jgi:hypothetical protein